MSSNNEFALAIAKCVLHQNSFLNTTSQWYNKPNSEIYHTKNRFGMGLEIDGSFPNEVAPRISNDEFEKLIHSKRIF